MADHEGFKDLIEFSKNVPILALRTSARKQISNYLDSEGFVIGEFTSDWYGLAEVIGYSNQEIRKFEQSDSPTCALLDNWSTRAQLAPNIDRLIQHLLRIQRPDVITECERNIRKDIEHQTSRSQHVSVPRPSPPVMTDDERFDAFVVYANTDRDIKFMVDMAKELEGERHNIKLFIPGRDDLAGTDKYPNTAETIANKCRRVIVILSTGFEHSEECDFALKFAQSLSPCAKTKRIIPILIDNIKIPLILNFVSVGNFTNHLPTEWMWTRVAATIKCPMVPFTQDLQCTIDDLKNMKYESKNVAHMFYGIGVALREFKDDEEEGGD